MATAQPILKHKYRIQLHVGSPLLLLSSQLILPLFSSNITFSHHLPPCNTFQFFFLFYLHSFATLIAYFLCPCSHLPTTLHAPASSNLPITTLPDIGSIHIIFIFEKQSGILHWLPMTMFCLTFKDIYSSVTNMLSTFVSMLSSRGLIALCNQVMPKISHLYTFS